MCNWSGLYITLCAFSVACILDLCRLYFVNAGVVQSQQISTHSSLDSLYKTIPMEMWPEEYLPDDYDGPSGGTIQQITGSIL